MYCHEKNKMSPCTFPNKHWDCVTGASQVEQHRCLWGSALANGTVGFPERVTKEGAAHASAEWSVEPVSSCVDLTHRVIQNMVIEDSDIVQ